jgi:Ca2+-binding RTX toxin-like protein
MMATQIEYALMSGASYISNHAEINRFPIPNGWTQTRHENPQDGSGFEAVTFTNGTEIVISYAGTDSDDWIGDIAADIALATGMLSEQLKQAADYYLAVKASNPGAAIALTGHSLGGGLAALIAVMFGEEAYTFDQAPFRRSALTLTSTDELGNTSAQSVAQELRTWLAGRWDTARLTALDAYIAANDPLNTSPDAAATLAGREAAVTNYNVQGEFLSGVPWNWLDRIGATAEDIPNSAAGVAGDDLHSQALLTAYLQSNQTAEPDRNLSDVTYKLPDLLKMVFDKNLFARDTDLKSKEENLLERLVRHEAGNAPLPDGGTVSADAMVTRFTSDLWKLAQDGGLTMSDQNPTNAELHELSNALIAFAMQYYYEDTANAVDAQKELFATDGIANGLRFDLGDVSEKIRAALEAGKEADLDDAKGYQYFANYLKQEGLFSAEERTQLEAWLPWMRDWTVQAGEGGMNATDTKNRGAFLLGGKEADTLTGGSADDLLAGNAGADTLDGNAGNDILLGGAGQDTLKGGEGVDLLIGGADNDSLDGGAGNDILQGGGGNDTYTFSDGHGTDIVDDSDSSGTLDVNGQNLGSGTKKLADIYQDEASGTNYIQLDGGKNLAIFKAGEADRILVKNWASDSMGIGLTGDDPATPAATLAGDFKKKIDDAGTPDDESDDTYVMGDDGNYTPDPDNPVEANALDLISGTAGNDVIDGGGGDDALSGGSGDDYILGGSGADEIQGGMGKDTIYGGDGADAIWASSNLALEKPTNVNFTKPVNQYTNPQGTGFNWTSGYNGTHPNQVPDGFSDTPRNRLDGDQGNYIDGGSGDDFIAAGTGADFVHGGSDKDWIYGMDKGDVLFGDGGNDLIYGDGNMPTDSGGTSVVWALPEDHGNDVIDGGQGNDYLYGQGKDDIIFGGSGDDKIWGDDDEAKLSTAYHGSDFLFGGAGADQIIGGAGADYLEGGNQNDTLLGGLGNDVYYYNAGDGVDSIQDNRGEKNIVRFGAGVDASKIKLHLGSLMLDLGNGDAIHIEDFDQNDVFNSSSIGNFEFADGSALTVAELLKRGFDLDGGESDETLIGTNTVDRISGLGGNDVLFGGEGNDTLSGGDGDDILYGEEGDDILIGGTGTELLDGGAGNDLYYFEAGDSPMSSGGLTEGILDSDGDDTVQFGGGITSDSLTLGKSQAGSYLLIDYNNGQDTLAIGNGLTGVIENFRFDDATLSWEELAAKGFDIHGSDGDDELSGTNYSDRFHGSRGNDLLAGGAGDDTYHFNVGDGWDTIVDAEGHNEVAFGAGLDRAALTVSQSLGMDGQRYLDLDFGNGDMLSIKDGELDGIAALRFADGSVLSHAELIQRLPYLEIGGTEGDDSLEGTAGDDSLAGGNGDDALRGNDGADFLAGGDGNDSLFGGAGDDHLDGGTGDDFLSGQEGVDTYRLASGMGADTVQERVGEVSRLDLGAGAARAALAHERSGDDLVIRFRDGSGSLAIAGYYLGGQDWEVVAQDGGTRSMDDFLAALDAVPADIDGMRADYRESVSGAWTALWSSSQGSSVAADGTVSWTSNSVSAYGTVFTNNTRRFRTVFDGTVSNGGVFFEEVAVEETTTSEQRTVESVRSGRTARLPSIGFSSGGSRPLFIPAGDGGGSRGSASGGNLLYVRDASDAVIGAWHYPEGIGLPTGGTVTSAASVTMTYRNTVSDYVVHVPEVVGDDGDNRFSVRGRGFVDAGAGDDILEAGSATHYNIPAERNPPGVLFFGNDGDDELAGSSDDDILIGGRGEDLLFGGMGADTYLLFEEDAVDYVEDAGNDLERYRDAYYGSLGLDDWRFNEEFGGMWRVHMDGWFYFQSFDEAVAAVQEVDWVAAIGVESLLAQGLMEYVLPLPELPVVAGNDHEAIEELVKTGVVRPDRIVFGPGVTADDLDYRSTGPEGTILLGLADGTGVTIQRSTADDPVGTGIERVEFADGSFLTMTEVWARIDRDRVEIGTDGDDTILSGGGNDVLRGGEGTDLVYGGAGDDLLIGDNGDDELYGGAGADTYRLAEGSSGNIWIADDGDDASAYARWYWTSLGIDDIDFRLDYGDRWIVRADRIYALDEQEAAEAWARHFGLDPESLAAAGDLRFVEALPDVPTVPANDFARVAELVETGAIRADRLVMDEGVTAANLEVVGDPALGYVELRRPDGTTVSVELPDEDSPLGWGIERVEFADGSFIGIDEVVDKAHADHVLVGTAGDDSFTLGAGNDTVRGLAGDDWLNGGRGDDLLEGGEGSDSYKFERGYGHDTIVEAPDGADRDVLKIGFDLGYGGVGLDSLGFARIGNDLVVTVADWEGDSLTVRDWFASGGGQRIEKIILRTWDAAQSDWLGLDAEEVEARVPAPEGPPTVSAQDRTLLLGESVAAGALIQTAGNVLHYQFWDDVAGGGRFVLDGVEQAAGAGIAVTADQLANLHYVAGSATATERVWARVSDGTTWSAWTPWIITSAPHLTNEAPMVVATDGTVGLNTAAAVAGLFSVSDADGDVPTKYEFWDDGQGGGRFVLDGVGQAAGTSIAVNAEQLAGLDYVGAGAMGSERVWARAWDGQVWSAWKSWNMLSSDHATNAAPVTQATNVTLLLGESAAVADLFITTDPDGDPIVKYEFWDDVDGGGRFVKGGIAQAAGTAIAVAADEMPDVAYAAGSGTGTERVWVRASDGVAWGAWTPWNITSAPHLTNAAPTVAASTGTAGLGQAVAASSLFTVSDPDGDVPTKYEFWDDVGGGGYFAKFGVLQAAGGAIAVTAAELSGFAYVGGDTMATERVWARAWDGQAWSAWTAWNMQSSNHATNAAPTVTAANVGVLTGDALAAVTLFAAVDPDGDPVVKYEFWDDVNGGGHFVKGGVVQAFGASIAVAATELADFDYVGGTAAATERVWVRASDGLAWSGWKAWNMTTVTGMQRGGPDGDSLIAHGEVLLGNDGNDSLAGPDGNNLLFGGAGDDALSSGPGNNFLAGGTGNDTLSTGEGDDVIAFNAGDGNDTIYLNGGVDTISLGGGIRYEDLALHQDGDDLVLATGNGESLTFKDWYADVSHRSALNLQLIAETLADFDAGGGDSLRDDKVEGFDFALLVERFEQARAENAAITQWHLMSDLLDAHLFGADDAALGGDLAYQYGRYGSFANVGLTGAQNVLNGSQFAIGPQSFQSLQGLQEGVARLG